MENQQRKQQTVYICRGLPGSGKSTWAKKQAKENPKIRRVSRDDLRRMLGDYNDFSPSRERLVSEIERAAVEEILRNEESVIVDDCNLNPRYVEQWEGIATLFDAAVIVQDFTAVPLRECLKRNHQRPGDERVPNKVIHDFYNKWLSPEKQLKDPNLPSAIICDLDGTLAIIGNRSPYDASKADVVDRINEPVAKLVAQAVASGQMVIFLSGREEKDREATIRFLRKLPIPTPYMWLLYMRTTRDHRPDYIVKRELYDQQIAGKYNIEYCIDDRDQIVDLWRSMGLTCFQVGEGWF